MKIGLQSWGTEGDIRPFIALAAGLSRAGHDVTLAATEIRNGSYSLYGEKLGFQVIHPGCIDVSKEEFSSLGRRMVRSKNPALKSRLLIDNFLNPVLPAIYEASRELCSTCDIVIGHLFVYPLKVAALKAETPWVSLFTTPLIASPDISPPGFPEFGSLKGWKTFDLALNLLWKPDMNRFYESQGLKKPGSVMNDVFFSKRLNLVSVSPFLFTFSVPAEYEFCGSFEIPSTELSGDFVPGLDKFLNNPQKPVYITFGSMCFGEQYPGRLLEILLDAVNLTGCRAIIQIEQSVSDGVAAGEKVFFAERTNHSSVFPRCAAVVHHGGCGTSHRVCEAGIPSVVVEYTADQPLWGRALKHAGVAPEMLHRRSLDSVKLAKAIRMVLEDSRYTDKAMEISLKMREEDGVSKAVALIEKKLGR